jgi:hypothetical protein
MTSRLPKRLKNFNLIVQNFGHAGLCAEVTLPDLTIKTDEIRNGGMDVPIEDDMGQEKMEIKWKLQENMSSMFRLWGLQDGSQVRLLFRGAASDGSKNVDSFEIEAHGKLMSIGQGSVKSGEPNEQECTLACRFLRITNNGSELVKIDALGMKRIVGGVDQLAAIRNAISD